MVGCAGFGWLGFDDLVVCFVGLSCRVLCFVIGWWISGLWEFSFSDVHWCVMVDLAGFFVFVAMGFG